MLTHNRRESFFKSIESVSLIGLDIDVEVILNCDDGSISQEDIDKLDYGFSIRLFNYLEFNDIYSNIYREANGDYIMYLEDDDVLLPGINKAISELETYELVVSLYEPYREGVLTYNFKEMKEKTKPYIPEYFQLSQAVFKKIDDLKFPEEYSHQNDEILLNEIINKVSKIKYIPDITFRQGVDGKNISLEDIN